MPQYKFTRVYVVDAPTKTEAFEKCKQNPTEYLAYESAVLVPEEKRSWSGSFVKQVTGK
jgi:hypothetical protein